jgi:hypothetical protein
MSLKNQIIVLSCLMFSLDVHAHEFFLAPLYWRATESNDWTYVNSMTTPNQTITYKTLDYDYAPGIRIGGLVDLKNHWDSQFFYTKFYTSTSDSTAGNLKSAFLGAKMALPSNSYFFQSGQISSSINYNMFDWNVGKRFDVTNMLMLRPLLGLETGWINQTFNTNFQGATSVAENISNNFRGIGPKMGIEGKLVLSQKNNYQANFIATFATSYLVGTWKNPDTLIASPPKSVNISLTNRQFGSLSLQALVGFGLDYKDFSIKAGYEINDWFNQCQIFDNDTGGHNNDLVLQGLTLSLSYRF